MQLGALLAAYLGFPQSIFLFLVQSRLLTVLDLDPSLISRVADLLSFYAPLSEPSVCNSFPSFSFTCLKKLCKSDFERAFFCLLLFERIPVVLVFIEPVFRDCVA